MADHHRAEFVVGALEMAAGRGALKEDCIAHSDRGSEYMPSEYRKLIRELKLSQSMGRTGSCYDNAAAESFFGLLKAEIGTTVWESHDAARADVFRFIEVEYNRTRLRKHPVYGYVTPIGTRALASLARSTRRSSHPVNQRDSARARHGPAAGAPRTRVIIPGQSRERRSPAHRGDRAAGNAYSLTCFGSIGISRAVFSARFSAPSFSVAVPQQRSYWFCQSVMNAS